MRGRAAVLLLCLAGCGTLFPKRDDAPPRERLTLCVENATVAYGNIVARAGQVRFDVMPGQQVCKRVIGGGGYIPLRAVTTGGGLAGPRSYDAQLPVSGYTCWRWRLSDSPASAADLGPCEWERDEPPANSAPADTGSADTSMIMQAGSARDGSD